MRKLFFVYIMTNKHNTVLYTGVTNNLKVRVCQHKNNLVNSFTSKYKVDKLVHYEFFEQPDLAIKREKQIKNLVRRKKIVLVEKFNSKWRDLYNELDL